MVITGVVIVQTITYSLNNNASYAQIASIYQLIKTPFLVMHARRAYYQMEWNVFVKNEKIGKITSAFLVNMVKFT